MGNSSKILLDKRMTLPKVYGEIRFENAVENVLNTYVDMLKEYSADAEIVKKVEIFNSNIKNMYSQYFLGYQNASYTIFIKALDELVSENVYTSELPNESFYRARINTGNIDYNDDEMFHIKYDLRGKVTTQRFSFPGLPCLYLGESSYVCWLELNRPSFEKFQVSMIRKNMDSEIKVLNLSMHPRNFYNDLSKGVNEVELHAYLLWWPIIALCSFVVKNENDPFKPEYIFPQYILQYLLEKKPKEVIGIKYMSTKAGKISPKQYEADHRTYTNYVFPIRSKDDCNGFCPKLRTQFKVIKNYSGRELQIITDLIRKSGIKWKRMDDDKASNPLDETVIYTTSGSLYSYGKSIFRRIEMVLDNKDNRNFDDDGELIMEAIPNEEIDKLFKECR